MNVAIYGAAGAIGRAVIPELLARGHVVRLVGRSRAKLEAFTAPNVEICVADIADPAQARRAADGIDAILFAVGLPYDQSARYPHLTRVAVEAAQAAGVGQFLLISTVYPYGRATAERVAETHPREPQTVKGRNRKAQADIVLAAHDPNGFRTATLVLPDFYGPAVELSYVKGIFDAAHSGKFATVIGPLDTPREYVFIPDVAAVIADLFARPQAFGRSYNLAGSGTITTRAFIAEVERASGTHIKTLAVNKTLLRLIGTFQPIVREVVEMYYLFTQPVVLDDSALRTVLPHLRKTSYADGIAATLAASGAGRVAIHA